MGNVLAATTLPEFPISSVSGLSSSLSSPEVEKEQSGKIAADPLLANMMNSGIGGEVIDFKYNPGTFEEIHRKCREIIPIPFEGARLIINKGLSNNFQVSHTLALNSSATGGATSGYRFGATYVGNKRYLSPLPEAFPVILADTDANGNLNSQIIHQPTGNVRLKFLSQIQNNKILGSQLSADFRSRLFTATLTVSPMWQNILTSSSADFLGNFTSGLVVAQFLHHVTPRLALGTEVVYQKSSSSAVPSSFMMPKQTAVMTVGAKYTSSDFVAGFTFGSHGAKASYWQYIDAFKFLPPSTRSSAKSFISADLSSATTKTTADLSSAPIPETPVSQKQSTTHVMSNPSSPYEEKPSLQIGCEVETNAMFGESVATIGYQVTLKEPNPILSSAFPAVPGGSTGSYIFRGFVDTSGSLGATLEKRLLPLPLTFTLSGAMNHVKGTSKFGIGLMLG